MRLLLEIIAIYFLYKLVVGIIIPLFKVGVSINKTATHLKQKMEEEQNPTQQKAKPNHNKKQNEESIGEYIDFEEIDKK